MANPIGLLLIGILSSFMIGRINHSYKTFLTCMLALAFGFVVGATAKKITSPLEKDNLVVVMMDNTDKGESTPILCALEPSVIQKPIVRYSSAVSKKSAHVDNLYSITPEVQTVHPVRCLSPPHYVYNGYSIPIDCDTS